MPSSPKIKKETIIQTAFQILIRNGYSEVNIKNVAKELNCSTQPISWQFRGMENFRKELLQYCIEYVNDRFYINNGDIEQILEEIAATYIDIACDMPNLYKYLYMDGAESNKMQEVAKIMRIENKSRIIGLLIDNYGISEKAAVRCLMNIEFYVHGIASYVVAGVMDLTKENIMDMVRIACKAFITAE